MKWRVWLVVGYVFVCISVLILLVVIGMLCVISL